MRPLKQPFNQLLLASALAAGAFVPTASAQLCDACQAGTIGGLLFEDSNANGLHDPGEPTLAGSVQVLTPEGVPFATVAVGTNGLWSVGPLACGNWIVLAQATGPYTLTSPALASGQHFASLLATGATLSQLDFGFQTTGCTPGTLTDTFNSGWDEVAPVVLASGAQDNDWFMTALWPVDTCITSTGGSAVQSYPDIGPVGHPVVYNYGSVWSGPQPNSEWVSVWPFQNTPNGEHYYQHCFCLAPGFGKPSLDFSIWADDEAAIFLNGEFLYSTPANGFSSALPYPQPGDPVVDPTPFFRAGANCVTVRVTNSYNVVTGFDIVGHVTAKNAECCAAPVAPAWVKGEKWLDQNGDGIQDPGEPLIAGWPIVLYDANHNVVPPTLFTDAFGQYAIGPLNPGNYSIGEGGLGGWTQTAPSTGEYDITLPAGSSLPNQDFGNQGPLCDLIVNQTVPVQSEGPAECCWDVRGQSQLVNGLTGAQVNVSPNVSLYGVTANPTWSQVTTATEIDWTPTSGTFVPSGLVNPGRFCAQVGPGGATSIEVSWLDANGDPVCPIQLTCGLSISGQKFNDLNGNGLHDANEPGLAGWTIQLIAPDGSIVTVVTDASGNYVFQGLMPGLYQVSEVQQPGWTQTFPAAPGTWSVDPSTGHTSGFDFGNHQTVTGGGCVDVVQESLLCGTDAPYTYTLDFVSNAPYDLAEVTFLGITPTNVVVTPNPYTFTTPVQTGLPGQLSVSLGGPGAVAGAQVCFTLSFHDATGANCCGTEVRCFPLPDCGCTNAISGVKYYDQNGNGVRDPGEPTLPGWTIVLQDGMGTTLTVVTDAFGEYAFNNVPHGTWTVSEVQQPGWMQTQPAGGAPYTLVLSQSGGSVVLHTDFGNTKKGTGPVDPADPTQPAKPAPGAAASDLLVVRQGAERVPMLPFSASAPQDEAVTLLALTVAAAGTGNDATDIAAVRLFEDVNANGIIEVGEPELAVGGFAVDNGVVTLTLPSPLQVAAGTHRDLLVTVDFAGAPSSSGALPVSGARPPWALLVALLALVGAAVALPRRRAAWLVAGLMGACAAQVASEPAPNYRLFLVHVDATLATSGREVRLADGESTAGPIVSVVAAD